VSSRPAQVERQPGLGWTLASALWPFAAAIVIGWVMMFQVAPRVGGYHATVLTTIAINIVLAVSLTVVNGLAGQFSLGHAGFMQVGGYMTAMLVYYGSMRLWGTADFEGGLLSYCGAGAYEGPFIARGDVLFVAACLFGGVMAALSGYVVGLPSLRLRGDYLAIVTLGFGEIVRVLFQATDDQIQPWKAATAADVPWWKFPVLLGGPKGFNLLPTYGSLFWVWFTAVLTLILIYRLKFSAAGREFLSVREDEVAAQAMGVNVTRAKVRAFIISAFFAGVAGGLYAMQIGAINAADLGFQKSFDVVIMVVLGGMGSISGAALAAVILTVLPEILRDPPPVWPAGLLILAIVAAVQWRRGHWRMRPLVTVGVLTGVLEGARYWAQTQGVNLADYRLIIYALMLIGMMIFRPEGLFGVHEVWDFFRIRRETPACPTPQSGVTA
jgi:branched-chain amino acid transport system permease protein